jgi:HK97 family phage major capsid protein
VEKVEKSLQNLEGAFVEHQKKQNKKIDHLYKVLQRPSFGEDTQCFLPEDREFKHYITKVEVLQTKALTNHTGASGGFVIPPQFSERISERLQNLSPVRSVARVMQIQADSLELLKDEGAADVGWVNESSNIDETSTPEFNKIHIPTHIMYAKPRASQNLLDDAYVDLESWLVQKISEKMAIQENAAFTKGDGKGKPKGFLSESCVPIGQGTAEKIESLLTGKNGDLNNSDTLIETINSLPTRYLAGAVWMMSRSALSAIRVMKNSSTGHYLWQPGLTENSPQTLLGYPVVINDDMPNLTSGTPSNFAVFGNFYEAYQIVDRQEMNVLRDPYSAKPFVEFYTTKRVGGCLIDARALKVVRASEEA